MGSLVRCPPIARGVSVYKQWAGQDGSLESSWSWTMGKTESVQSSPGRTKATYAATPSASAETKRRKVQGHLNDLPCSPMGP